MNIPQIEFASAGDGPRVAYWALGSGDPLLYVGVPCLSHAQLELRLPQFVDWYEKLSSARMLVRLDLRGYGASQRDDCELSVAGFMRDVLAVADALSLTRFSIFAQGGSAAPALALAAESGVVERLIICDGWADGRKLPIHERIAATAELAPLDWELFSKLMVGFFMGVRDDQAAVAWFMRQCVHAPAWRDYLALMRDTDVTPILPRVACPVLVLHTGPSLLNGQGEASQAIARAIPGARLVSLLAPQFPLGDTHPVYEVVDTFLRPGAPPPPSIDVSMLSPREREVLVLVTRGRTNREIAEELIISPATADRHVHNILTKLGLVNRTEAAAWAATHVR